MVTEGIVTKFIRLQANVLCYLRDDFIDFSRLRHLKISNDTCVLR